MFLLQFSCIEVLWRSGARALELDVLVGPQQQQQHQQQQQQQQYAAAIAANNNDMNINNINQIGNNNNITAPIVCLALYCCM